MFDLFLNVFLSIPLIGAFAMFALGISVIYRASRVLNLAHGAMAMVPAYVFYTLDRAGVPMPLALVGAIVAGAGLGVGVEWLFVRRLRAQGPTAQTVGTVAAAGLLISLAAKIWGTTPIIAPRVFPAGELRIAGVALRYGDIGLFAVGIAVSAGLFAFFKRTEIGLAMRGAAQNRRAATLMGVDPDLAASAAWALGGGLAALAGVLLAAVTNLDPYNLSLQVLPAFVAALIGGLQSLLGALAGSVIAGLAFGFAPTLGRLPLIGSALQSPGTPQLALTILALVVMAARGRRLSGAEAAESGFTGGLALRPRASRQIGPGAIVFALALLVLPWMVPFSFLGDAILAMELALVALSLVVLTGWVGQISLAQASFVGLGALVTALAVRGWGVGFPFSLLIGAFVGAVAAALLGVVALRVRGLYLAVATLIFAWMADQFLFRSPWLGAAGGTSGIPAQRIGSEGGFPSLDLTSRTVLYFILLAVVVLVVVSLANLRSTKTGRAFFAVRGSEMAAASLGIDVVRTKLAAFALSGLLAGFAGSLLLIEQRTVVPAQFLFTVSLQYLAIAVVGGLGSLGGALAAGVTFAALNELFFQVRALAGWLEVVSAGLLGLVLLTYPGGLAAAPEGIRRILEGLPERRRALAERLRIMRPARQVSGGANGTGHAARTEPARATPAGTLLGRISGGVVRFRERLSAPAARALARLPNPRNRRAAGAPAPPDDWYAVARAAALPNGDSPALEPPPAVPAPGSNGHHAGPVLRLDPRGAPLLLPSREAREPLVEADCVTVRFGGLTAVNAASLTVRRHEIVGLIGPNGAGKTTLFNAILGLNDPADGRTRLYGHDVTGLPPHLRARLGIARTFQVLQLFNDLTVTDNLLVATHLHNESGLLSNLAASGRTVTAELAARERVHAVLELLQLEEVSGETARNLPFGVLRMVELGRALVTGAQVIMLDEPASGLNEQETDRLMEVVRGIRALGVTVLLIEHDVRMVTGVSDYVYVLDQGRMIAEGTPHRIVRDEQVIKAYLGAAPVEHAGAEA